MCSKTSILCICIDILCLLDISLKLTHKNNKEIGLLVIKTAKLRNWKNCKTIKIHKDEFDFYNFLHCAQVCTEPRKWHEKKLKFEGTWKKICVRKKWHPGRVMKKNKNVIFFFFFFFFFFSTFFGQFFFFFFFANFFFLHFFGFFFFSFCIFSSSSDS